MKNFNHNLDNQDMGQLKKNWSPWWTMNLSGNQKYLIMMGGN
jgi:hypothetical protein